LLARVQDRVFFALAAGDRSGRLRSERTRPASCSSSTTSKDFVSEETMMKIRSDAVSFVDCRSSAHDKESSRVDKGTHVAIDRPRFTAQRAIVNEASRTLTSRS